MPKLLFVSTSSFYPDVSGGAELSAIYLFESLRQLGWKIEVICMLSLRSPYFQRGVQQRLKHFQMLSGTMVDYDLGYACWRRIGKFSTRRDWIDLIDLRLREYQPDVVLSHDFMCPLLNYANHQGYPSFYFAHTLGDMESGRIIPDGIHVIANSPFTASVASQLTSKEVEIVLVPMDLLKYKVTKRERQYITFINPIPEKGVEVAIEIARCLPQESFLFVKGKWGGNQDRFLKPVYELPNVEVWDNQQDMRRVYAVTDILLAPSQFIETFGRVIVEAQSNRIPVVASGVGGIPYTLGKGGILITTKTDPQPYMDALRRLRTDEDFYKQRSELAFENSQRPDFDHQKQVKNFIRFVESRI
jgi:glycosyltransferase involved in cell wall biosynthesis